MEFVSIEELVPDDHLLRKIDRTMHLKANANKNKFERKEVERSTKSYLEELNLAVADDRETHGKKPLRDKPPEEPPTKETRVSTTAAICKGLLDRGIFGVIDYRRLNHKKGFLHKRQYRYDAQQDCYHCPGSSQLHYRTTNRKGYRGEYKSAPSVCSQCPAACKMHKQSQPNPSSNPPRLARSQRADRSKPLER